MEKVAPSERFRRELDEVLAGVGGEEDPIETVGRLGARLILQQAGETVSHRNGYEARTVKTTSGAMRLERPRIRDAASSGSRAGSSASASPGLVGVVSTASARLDSVSMCKA
jgi:hypothetical protein